ncbi:hypothetical protein L7F22_062164 [Adiantum nelumboides]|nr:hypothetical protein [Adiantum nelumboides]
MLTGAIPGSLARVLTLESLDLSDNLLNGAIPPQLANLTSLAFLNLSDNRLSGKIPTGGCVKYAASSSSVSCGSVCAHLLVRNQFDSFTNQSYLGNADLCGLPLTSVCVEENNQDFLAHRSPTSKWKTIGGCVSGVVATACMIALVWYLVKRKTVAGKAVSIQTFDTRVILSLKELLDATNKFSDANIIGSGGSCTVYKGVLSNNMVVAVKKLDSLSHQEGQTSFVSESTVLGQIRHRNLARILGTLSTKHMKCLILEYISNGTLDTHLHNDACVLSWDRRFQVAVGVAQGLSYLHSETGVGQVLHCDLKPGNILLDEDYEPHISDFGIARLIGAGKDGESAVEAFRGSFGYVAPGISLHILCLCVLNLSVLEVHMGRPAKYAYGGKITAKGDVYSFGIVLLEMLTRKQPTSDAFAEGTSMTLWVEAAFRTNWIDVIDAALIKDLADERLMNGIYSVLVIAMSCAKKAPGDRPSMTHVLEALLNVRKGKPCQMSFEQFISSPTPEKGDTSSVDVE